MKFTKPSYRPGATPKYNTVEITPVTRFLEGKYYSFMVICTMTDKDLAPDFKLRREATAAHRDFIALLKKHGWKAERKPKC